MPYSFVVLFGGGGGGGGGLPLALSQEKCSAPSPASKTQPTSLVFFIPTPGIRDFNHLVPAITSVGLWSLWPICLQCTAFECFFLAKQRAMLVSWLLCTTGSRCAVCRPSENSGWLWAAQGHKAGLSLAQRTRVACHEAAKVLSCLESGCRKGLQTRGLKF